MASPSIIQYLDFLEIFCENLIDQVGFIWSAVGIPNIVDAEPDGEKGVMTGPGDISWLRSDVGVELVYLVG